MGLVHNLLCTEPKLGLPCQGTGGRSGGKANSPTRRIAGLEHIWPCRRWRILGRALRKQLLQAGWTTLCDEWNGVFWHDATKSLLIAYVDDFKLVAKAELHDQLWKRIKSVIDMDDELPMGAS